MNCTSLPEIVAITESTAFAFTKAVYCVYHRYLKLITES